jgi:hypothetical protein
MTDWLHKNIETWTDEDCEVYVKSTEGSVLKILFEVYQKQIITNNLEFTKKGIFSQQQNQRDDMLFDLALNRDNFDEYKCPDKSYWVGLNSADVASFYHNVKKKEAVEMGVPVQSPDNHLLGVIPLEGMSSRLKSGYIRNQRVQQQKIDPPVGYGDPVLIKGVEFQKSVKDMSRTTTNATREVTIKGGHRWISFWGDSKGVQGSSVIFGNKTNNSKELVKQTYDCSSLSSITKAGSMGGTSAKIKIYIADNLPLRIEFPVGGLGTLNVYIKSHELLQKESEESDAENSDVESDGSEEPYDAKSDCEDSD